MLTEQVFIPFVLNKTSKIHLQLAGSLEFKGEGWRCCLQTFSLEKKWSLMNEVMTIIYTNGYKSIIKPKTTHSVHELDKILEEMFEKRRPKRSESEPPKEVVEPIKPANTTEKTKRDVTPPPFIAPLDFDKKPVITDERMKVVTFPSDEPGKEGQDKYYIVYKNLKDAFLYSPELPIQANHFTEHAHESIKFTYNDNIERYEVSFDNQYVRAIHLSKGFAKALGFKEIVFNNDVATLSPAKEGLHNYLHIYLNDIISPIDCGLEKQTILDAIAITPDPNPITENSGPSNYLKMALTRVEHIDIEFKDVDGNPIYGANANGHVFVQFVKSKK